MEVLATSAAQQVSKDDLKIMQKYQFDVWVAAYNWLDAHETQAEKVLLPRIRDKILGSYKELLRPAGKGAGDYS